MPINIWTKRAMKNGISLVALILPMILMSIVSAVEYKVGVKAGDWVKYGEISASWTGTETAPQYITDTITYMEQMDWVKIEVQSVRETTVKHIFTIHYKNGTDETRTETYDVKSTFTEYFPFIISANLRRGDDISTYPSMDTISETLSKVYAGASRNVNVFHWSSPTGDDRTTFYWDQATGIMLEMVSTNVPIVSTNEITSGVMKLEMIKGNLLYILIIVVAIIVIIVGVPIHNNKWHQNHDPK